MLDRTWLDAAAQPTADTETGSSTDNPDSARRSQLLWAKLETGGGTIRQRLSSISEMQQTLTNETRELLASEQVPTRKHADWVRRNMATDYVLIEMCGSRLYQAMLEPLIKLTQEIVLVVKPERTIIHDPQEHQIIVEAVLKGDGKRAADAMRKHIKNVGDSLIGLEESYRERKGLAREALG